MIGQQLHCSKVDLNKRERLDLVCWATQVDIKLAWQCSAVTSTTCAQCNAYINYNNPI